MTNAAGPLASLDAHPVSKVATVISDRDCHHRSEGEYRPVATYAHSFPSWTSLTDPEQRKLDAIAPAR